MKRFSVLLTLIFILLWSAMPSFAQLGGGTYDDRNAAFSYAGTTTQVTDATYYLSTYTRLDGQNNGKVTFSFTGDSFTLYTTNRPPATGTINRLRLIVDGAEQTTQLGTSSDTLFVLTTYTYSGFGAGTHSAEIRGDTAGSRVHIDRIDIPVSATNTPTPTFTFTPTLTPTPTFTFTPTPTFTFTPSDTPTFTPTFTPSATDTGVPSPTPTFTPSATDTGAPSATHTFTPSATNTGAPSATHTFTPSATHTAGPSPTIEGVPLDWCDSGNPMPSFLAPGLYDADDSRILKPHYVTRIPSDLFYEDDIYALRTDNQKVSFEFIGAGIAFYLGAYLDDPADPDDWNDIWICINDNCEYHISGNPSLLNWDIYYKLPWGRHCAALYSDDNRYDYVYLDSVWIFDADQTPTPVPLQITLPAVVIATNANTTIQEWAISGSDGNSQTVAFDYRMDAGDLLSPIILVIIAATLLAGFGVFLTK